MRKRKWYRVINITLALTLVLGGMLANFALLQPVSATVRLPRNTPSLPPAGPRPAFAADPIVNITAASGAPGSVLDSAGTNGGEKLLQFTSAGHVLGFAKDGVIVASARHMLRIDFLNARAVAPEADGDVSGESSTGAAPPLGRVTYRNVWDGVTVVYEASGASIVKSTYLVDATKEGVQVDRIRLGYNRPVQIDEKGNLLIVYENGTIVEGAPVAWQETEGGRKPVTAAYVLRGEREVGFSLGDYTPGIPVVIDPVMTWNTFLGGSGTDYGYQIAVDGSGNVYVSGYSSATWGSPVRAYTSGNDAFAAKLNSSGALQWNTFLGGSGSDDVGRSIAVDGSGNVYVGGYGNATWGSPVRAYTLGSDAFAAKLDSSGNLTWNTFLGGSGGDYGYGIAVDGSGGNVYVSGSSGNWGTSPVRAYYGSGTDAFAAKLDSSGALTWHTFLGDSGEDSSRSIAVDGSGNVYAAGFSSATWGSPVRAYTSLYDLFAAKLNSSGALTWNTFLGGSGTDNNRGIVVDSSGNVYVAGFSNATWGSPVRAYYGSGYDAFAAELDSSGALTWNTFLGGSGTDDANGIAIDGSGNVYVAGQSTATWGSPVRAYTLGSDAFAAKLDSSGALTWNTFLGGSGTDYAYGGIAVDSSGNVYVCGESNATWGSPVRAYTSGYDAFAAWLAAEQTAVDLSYFRATSLNSQVVLEWGTATEIDNEGFNILRREGEDGVDFQVNPYLIPSIGTAGFGAEYSYVDTAVVNGITYFYMLEAIDIYGESSLFGPVKARANDIMLIWPEDGATVSEDSCLFIWSSSTYSQFKVDISPDPTFSDSETLYFPKEGWTEDQSLYLTPRQAEQLSRIAEPTGGQLFWRVRARDEDGRAAWSEARKLVFEILSPSWIDKTKENRIKKKIKIMKSP